MLYDAPLAQEFAARLLDRRDLRHRLSSTRSVPQGEARIRVQVSAAHEKEQLDRAVGAFAKIGGELNVLS